MSKKFQTIINKAEKGEELKDPAIEKLKTDIDKCGEVINACKGVQTHLRPHSKVQSNKAEKNKMSTPQQVAATGSA